jgi:hypothetical protein
MADRQITDYYSFMPGLSREQFFQRVLDYVAVKFPLVKLARGEDPFSLRINGNFASLENLYRMTILRPEDMNRQVDRWMVELLRASEGAPDVEGGFDELKGRIYPMVLPEVDDEDYYKGSVIQPLVSGLMVGYAIDHDRTISYISQPRFDKWNISVEELHETALENLVARSETMAANAAQDDEGKVYLILFQTMDGYDASRILLPTLHQRLREYLGSPFAAAVPNRDILLCFRNDEETVGRLLPQIESDFQQMPHQVTDKVMLVTPDGIAPRG